MRYLLSIFLLIGINVQGQNRLLIPDTLIGASFELNLQNGVKQFYEGEVTSTMGANGGILGPTLIMNKGDYVDIIVRNGLGETTTIHWHGMHVSASNDGGPHTTIAPGESWNPRFTVLDKAGTYWYHPHLHEQTNKHVSLGLAGFIIVRDEEEASLDLPRTYGVDDFPLVLQTKGFDTNNQILVPTNSDNVVMVNATINPSLELPAQVVRFRLLNGSSQRVFNIGLTGNKTFYQIGSDGGLLNESLTLTRLQIAPGERAEILINLSGMLGQPLEILSYASELQNGIYGASSPGIMPFMTLDGYNPNQLNGADFKIMTLNIVSMTENPVTNIPEALAEIERIPEASAILTRNLSFTPAAMGPNQLNGNFLINGETFNMDIINYSVNLDDTEIWSISNNSAIAHPFHIHDVQFYILDRNGVAPAASEQGRKDVVLIRPQETVRFITKFEDFADDPVPYMYHCHMLTHEDNGMMGQFAVVSGTNGIVTNLINQLEIKIYPNPVGDKIQIEYYENAELQANMVDISGNTVRQFKLWKGSNTISTQNLSPGLYFLKVQTQMGNGTYKFIKQ